jgi:hypothetical protein
MPLIPAIGRQRWRIVVQKQSREKVSETLPQQISQVWWHMLVVLAILEYCRLRQLGQKLKILSEK